MGELAENQIMMSCSNSDFVDKPLSDVNSTLETYGFKNISTFPAYDQKDNSSKIGTVAYVSIGGIANYKRGDIFDNDASVDICYHESESKDPVKIEAAEKQAALEREEAEKKAALEKEKAEKQAALEKNVPKYMARRAVITAITNSLATDVFAEDGNTLVPSKFHSYDDIGDFFLAVDTEGSWFVLDENTWHLENMILRIYDIDTYVKVNCCVKKDGDNYIVFNVNRGVSTKHNILNDPSKVYIEHSEPSEFNLFLTVPTSLIEKDRDDAAANEKITAKEKRLSWISSQFSAWDGQPTKLSKLVKKQLNDEKSFKYIDRSYIDIANDDVKNDVNNVLKECGFSQRVEVGDLFVREEFSAKNAFNATIKATAYGIYKLDGTVILVGIT